MSYGEREPLLQRYVSIQVKLAELAEGRVFSGDPAEVESQLIAERDEIALRLRDMT
jgi:hypothetical protein